MKQIELELRGEHITLDALLKATGLAHSGGGAKQMVLSGQVQVNGQPETRRSCKLRANTVVAVAGTQVLIHAPAAHQGAPAAIGDPRGPCADEAKPS